MTPDPLPLHPDPPAGKEGETTDSARPGPTLRLVMRREHSLLALMELSRTLWRAQDLHSTVDALVLNIMGQIGSARAALWLRSQGARGLPVLIRSHGLTEPEASTLLLASWAPLLERFEQDPRPVRVDEAAGWDAGTRALVERAHIAAFGPLRSESEIVGMLALGAPAGGRAIEDLDLQMLEASLEIAGVVIRNSRLHARVLDSHRQLQTANESLRELDRLKSQFIDNVSHELRTPLTVVIGCLQCLADFNLAPEAGRNLVESASTNAQRLLRLIESLLTFSTASRGSLSVEPADADVAEFLAEYHARRAPGVSGALRELVLTPASGPRMANFDPRRLRSILDALVDNAVRFTPEGTRIGLELGEQIEAGGRWVTIGVRDSGPGIAREQMASLFETFRQGDGSMTRTVGGVGMGLPTAQKVAEAMGGRITAASEPGKGCLFTVTLRAA